MAGNTKLRGFGQASTIELERWGVRISIKLPYEAIKELRRACHELLPLKPPERTGSLHPDEFTSTYDESVGRVRMEVAPVVAKQLAELLRHGAQDVKKENADLAENCAQELDLCYQAHLDYLDIEEPGVEK